MAQGPPPQQPYPPSGPQPLVWQSPAAILGIAAAAIVGVFVIAFVLTGITGAVGFPSFFFLPFCAVFVVIIIVIVLAVTQGFSQQRIPPPPPIQQPMVPAGQVGPIALNCPNCGAPPQNVDRFGVATCTYCNTRYLVR